MTVTLLFSARDSETLEAVAFKKLRLKREGTDDRMIKGMACESIVEVETLHAQSSGSTR